MIIQPGSLVFDIGGNIGQSVDRFLAAGAGRVISVEPCFQNYSILRERESAKVTTIMAACGAAAGIIDVHFDLEYPGRSTVDIEKWSKAYPIKRNRFQSVPVITLDLLRAKYGDPHFIKIDVEGFELQVLHGLGHKSPRLSFEFHHKLMNDAHDCLDRLVGLGYSRFAYTTEDADLITEPFLGIQSFKIRLLDEHPDWGNITAS